MKLPSFALSLKILILVVAAGVVVFFQFTPKESIKSSDVTTPVATSPKTAPLPAPQENSKPIDESNSSPSVESPVPISQPISALPEIVWGDRGKRQVIFTFDGGAGSQSAQAILDTLDQYGVRGTFFLTGAFVNTNQSLVRLLSSRGHEIYNHTWSHPDLTTVSDQKIIDEFSSTENLIQNLTGRTTKPYFRPPFGSRNAHVLQVAATQGYRSVYWSIDALDWKTDATASGVESRILQNLAPGTIYLMHIGDDITGRILAETFSKIRSQGYSIVSLTQGL